MTTTVDYYFAVVSPWSYLGDARLREITGRYGATLKHKPVNTPTIFSRTGGLQLKDRSDQRKAYRMQELNRWRDHLDAELTLEPRYFPTNDQLAARTVAAARQSGEDPSELVHALMRACWVEDQDVAEPSVVSAALAAAGLDADKEDVPGLLVEPVERARRVERELGRQRRQLPRREPCRIANFHAVDLDPLGGGFGKKAKHQGVREGPRLTMVIS